MFPIRDSRGRVFGGRVLGDEKPKYLNSPDCDISEKLRVIWFVRVKKKQGEV